tara:strand:+ start:62 stop:781 length:720 start_codon:yes stop_codon:yes gene_type:complete
MVSIDTVYQKVLMFANKEQRGYITPQEFNLFADQAQKEIFEQYFYDLNQFQRLHGNSEEYSDGVSNLNEKIAQFEKLGTINSTTPPIAGIVAAGLYRLGTLMYNDGGTPSTTVEIEEVQQNEIILINESPLLSPSELRPVYVRTGNLTIDIYPIEVPIASGSITCTYIATPTKPNWSYIVVNGNAMYDPSNKTDFELHPSEEGELVYKILKFAGISMKRNDIIQAAQGLETLQVQQEKA